MHLSLLSTNMMLNVSARWLGDSHVVQSMQAAGPLGHGLHDQLKSSHEHLADIERRRANADATLRALIGRATVADGIHDRKARSAYYHLGALADGTDDPKLADRYLELQAQLFPQGLRVTRLPYIEEGGAAVALDRSVDIELRTELAGIQVGDQNMLTLFESWMQAGHELGQIVTTRANLQLELTRERSDAGLLDIKSSRNRWIQTVRGLLWAIDTDEHIAQLADRIRAPLERALADAQRRRADQGSDDALDDGGDAGDELGEDEDPFAGIAAEEPSEDGGDTELAS